MKRLKAILLLFIILVFALSFSLMIVAYLDARRVLEINCTVPLCKYYFSARSMADSIFVFVAVGLFLAFIVSLLVLIVESRLAE